MHILRNRPTRQLGVSDRVGSSEEKTRMDWRRNYRNGGTLKEFMVLGAVLTRNQCFTAATAMRIDFCFPCALIYYSILTRGVPVAQRIIWLLAPPRQALLCLSRGNHKPHEE